MKRLFRISPCPVCGKPVSPLSRFYVRDGWICRECADLAGCRFGGNSVSTADRLALMRTEEIAGQVQKEKAEHAAIVRAFSADWTNLFVVTGVLSASDRRGKKQIVGIVLKGEFTPGSEPAEALNFAHGSGNAADVFDFSPESGEAEVFDFSPDGGGESEVFDFSPEDHPETEAKNV